jgi:hypothetical protein
MTLHYHKVDDRAKVFESTLRSSQVPAGWQIAAGDADDVRVCCAHPWQSQHLVFASGDAYGTAACDDRSRIGACARSGCSRRQLFRLMLENRAERFER